MNIVEDLQVHAQLYSRERHGTLRCRSTVVSYMWFVISMLAIALIWALFKKKSPSAARGASPLSSDIARIAGDGLFAVEVVGESNCAHNFEKICGPRSRDGVNRNTRAILALENSNPHDRNAVRVSIDGLTVGYLSRANALNFRQSISAAGHAKFSVFECGALIRGGWDNGRGKQGHYGVWLDIPRDK